MAGLKAFRDGRWRSPDGFDPPNIAKADEPKFTLIGRDPCAGATIRLWVTMRQLQGRLSDKRARACLQIADEMDAYAKTVQAGDPVIVTNITPHGSKY